MGLWLRGHRCPACRFGGPWTGYLQARDVRADRARLRSPAAVGWRRDWWGAGNPELNARCERDCGKIETPLPGLLANIETR
jgi:hypothetical protein